jgi:hypothetical protein
MLNFLRERTAEVAADRVMSRYLYVSNNSKTGVSINLPIAGSCTPTRACRQYCYAMEGPIVRNNSLGRQVDNLNLLNELETAPQDRVNVVVLVLAGDIDRANRQWIRWHGVGDLVPGSVRVINTLVEKRPDLVQWVVTRKPGEAIKLRDHPSIRLLLSFDASTAKTTTEKLKNLRHHFKKAKVRFSWVREDEQMAPPDMDIVFHEHTGRFRLDVKKQDSRTCYATLPGVSHENACDSCQRCFEP